MERRAAAVGKANALRYLFPTNEGLNGRDAAKAVAVGLPIERLMPDIHTGAGGGVAAAVGLFARQPHFPQRAINCETNAGKHDHRRALQVRRAARLVSGRQGRGGDKGQASARATVEVGEWQKFPFFRR